MNIPVSVRDWLLEPENPSVRFHTLTALLGAPLDDLAVKQARAAIVESQAVQKIFARMPPDGYWLHRGYGAGVSYAMRSSTHFVLAYLDEWGLVRTDARVARAVERYLSLNGPDKPGPDPHPWEVAPDYANRQSCLYAYNIRTFVKLGYRGDPRLQTRVDVLLDDWRADGGYLCIRPTFGPKTKSCIRGAHKALMAFAELPELWDTARCKALVDYFLRRQVIYKSRRPGELIRGEVVATIFPFIISASLLEALYALSRMGYAEHPALADAWKQLEAKRDDQGRYLLDRSLKATFNAGPDGQPNKWVTLYAYLALTHLSGIQ